MAGYPGLHASNLAFSIWMLKGFFDTVPQELEQAAMADGCTRFQASRRVIIPLAFPGVAPLPTLCSLLFAQRYITEGMTVGAVKG
ncbi:MAG: ABC transporter permease subunit [Treponema sp.]|nr:ABC transporter permease subunit [Treponema sp.]